ncbi:hypothetical protein TWF281_000784 [Arthrobotrys megalospora]
MKLSAIMITVASVIAAINAAPAALPEPVPVALAEPVPVALAEPVPVALPEPVPVASAELAGFSPNPAKELEERANNGANCRWKYAVVYNIWKVIVWGPWAQDNSWGRGLLDNLRGQCGVITDWQFYYRADRSGVATFKTHIFCPPSKVQDAIWLASGPKNAVVRCTKNL